ncbi:MAG: spondin domain-containing protein, partial [Gemmatimonadetes bacterium]|nr:spondin domain-containing protein [Gemmatimonadota bacterium]
MQLRLLRPWRFGALLVVPLATVLSAPPAASQTITYQVKFEGNWTLASTPGGVVGGAHFTTLIGGVHGSGVTFWEAGQQASAGVEGVAELGSTGTFRNEVQASSHTLSVIQEGVTGTGTGTATFNIDVTRTHSLVTLLSMIGPSPDWFVGVSGISLLDGSDQWRESHVVDLFPYDAGTEDGTEFTLNNSATNPQGVITRIAGTGKFSNVRMARLTFTRMTTPPPPPTPTVSLSVSPNPVDEGQPVTVTAELSAALTNSVTIPLALTAGTAESDDFGSLASITITGGLTTGTGTISTVDDADTDDETFTVALGTLPTEVTAGSPSSVVVTIRDGDSPPPPPT